ncbi:TPA: flagellar export protein FliJ [Aeromonas salmonicida]
MSKGLVMLSERLLEAEQQAGLALAKAQQDLKIFMEQQEALNQYRQIYHQQWTDRGLQGIGAQQNAQYHAFISKLEQAATQQRRKAVELLLAKQAGREQQKAQRQEQKMLDEYAMLRRFHHSGL